MSKAKRRKQLDPNYGQSNVLENACKHIDELLLQQEKTQAEDVSIFSLFTNNDRGCDDDELDLLQSKIPFLYYNKNFTIWILPKKYASSSVDEDFPSFHSSSCREIQQSLISFNLLSYDLEISKSKPKKSLISLPSQ